ncbi:hypothetical protein A0H81_12918 [Grifola frondosa]|uniref:Uncharacterized protein n=1 Tax=Grifola frondosa TaxID=5627 RepID=A0A1C7LTL7_GRIFR|nr:hypothetical protein A0H81_12918 [Grifola frondosa]
MSAAKPVRNCSTLLDHARLEIITSNMTHNTPENCDMEVEVSVTSKDEVISTRPSTPVRPEPAGKLRRMGAFIGKENEDMGVENSDSDKVNKDGMDIVPDEEARGSATKQRGNLPHHVICSCMQ